MTVDSARSNLSVVVIDDDPDQRLAIIALFSQRGIDVATQAENATKGLEYVATVQPDLVVLDLAMPGRSGIDVLPDLHRAAPNAAIVVVSNMPRHHWIDEVVRRGATGFVEKAVAPNRLVEEILVAAALTDAGRSDVLALAASTRSPGESRRFVRELLADADRSLVADAELVVSELVTNAIIHANSEPLLEVHLHPDRVRIEVYDAAPGLPVEREPAPREPGGRGIRVVSELSSRWGSAPCGSGKVVWAEIDR